MKRLVIYILMSVLIVILVDVLFGVFSDWYVRNRALPGDYENVDYLIRRCDDDVVILGSSIALNSLVPSVVEDSLHMTCFNGGANGQALPFFESMAECLLKRYKPRMIILGFTPDQLTGTGAGVRYNFLVPYYHKGFETIDHYLESQDRIEPYLLKSSLYRYNTIWWRILLYHFITPDEKGEKGFVAKGVPAVCPTLYERDVDKDISEERKVEFERIVEECLEADVKLVVYFPPQYYLFKGDSATEDYVRDYCAEHGIPCFNDSQDRFFLENKELFHDNVHLNKNGAYVYSRMFVERLKEFSVVGEKQ